MMTWLMIVAPWFLAGAFLVRWLNVRREYEQLLDDLVRMAEDRGAKTHGLERLDRAYDRLRARHPHRSTFSGWEINDELRRMEDEPR